MFLRNILAVLLICKILNIASGENNEAVGVYYIQASSSRTYVLITKEKRGQHDANVFCRDEFSGQLATIRDEDDLTYVEGNLTSKMSQQPSMIPTSIESEIWVHGKTDVAGHGLIDVATHPLRDAGSNCVVLSNSSPDANVTTASRFQLYSKSDCTFNERQFLCETTPEDINKKIQDQAEFWFEGTLYKPVFNQLASLTGANDICQRKYGGSLASITTQHLLDGVRDKLKLSLTAPQFSQHNAFWICGKVYHSNGHVISLDPPPTFQEGENCVVIASRTEEGTDNIVYEMRSKACNEGVHDFFCVMNGTDNCPNGVTTHVKNVWFDNENTRYIAVLNTRVDQNSSEAVCMERHGARPANITTIESLDAVSSKLRSALSVQHRDAIDEFWVAGTTSLSAKTALNVQQNSQTEGENCVVLSNPGGSDFSLYAEDCEEVERRVLCEIPIFDLVTHDYGQTQYLFVMNHSLSLESARDFCHVQYGGDLMDQEDRFYLFSPVTVTFRSQLDGDVNTFWIKQSTIDNAYGKWEVHRGKYCYANDITRVAVTTAEACMEHCYQRADCVAIVFSEQAYSTRKCYLKQRCDSFRNQPLSAVYVRSSGETCNALSLSKGLYNNFDITTVPCTSETGFVCSVTAGSGFSYYYLSDKCDDGSYVSNVRLDMSENDCGILSGKWASAQCILQLCGNRGRNVKGWIFSSPGACDSESLSYTVTVSKAECRRFKGTFDIDGAVVDCKLLMCNTTKEPHLSYIISTRTSCPIDNVLADVTVQLHPTVCKTLNIDDTSNNITATPITIEDSQLLNVWQDCHMVLCQVEADCKRSILGETYKGTLSYSASGRECRRWDTLNKDVSAQDLPDDTIADAVNYCRNPMKWAEGPYCYVDDTSQFEVCNMPFCNDIACSPDADTAYIEHLPDSSLSGTNYMYSLSSYAQSKFSSVVNGSLVGGWIPNYNHYWYGDTHYITADLGAIRRLDTIATKGCAGQDWWVKTYNVKYSLTLNTRSAYNYVLENDGHVRTFAGNTDRDSIEEHAFKPPLIARYIRLYPITHQVHVALRWEVYGCDTDNMRNVETIQIKSRQYILVPGHHHDPWEYCARAYGAHGAIFDTTSADLNNLRNVHWLKFGDWMTKLSSRTPDGIKLFVHARIPSSHPGGILDQRTFDELLDWHGDSGWCVYLTLAGAYAVDCESYQISHFLCERQQERFYDYQVEGGIPQPDLPDLEKCVIGCTGDCRAAGYNSLGDVCVHYVEPDDCKPGRSHPGFTYVQKAPCECHRRVSDEQVVGYSKSNQWGNSSEKSNWHSLMPLFVGHTVNITALKKKFRLDEFVINNTNDSPWIQIRMQFPYKVYGIITEGLVGGHGWNDSWVKSYSIAYSEDCITYTNYSNNKVLYGNTSPKEIIMTLEQAFYAKCVQLKPLTCANNFAIKFDLLACTATGTNIAIGKQTWQSSTKDQNAASYAVDGFLHATETWQSCSVTNPAVGAYFVLDLGYIYDVEKIVLQTRRQHIDPGNELSFKLRVDDSILVYADGVFVGNHSVASWHEPYTAQLPLNTSILAFKAGNWEGPGGVVGELSNGMVTGSNWKCTKTTPENADWQKGGFDDSSWPAAHTYGSNNRYSSNNWGLMPEISDIAVWIWTEHKDEEHSFIYCRVKLEPEPSGDFSISVGNSYRRGASAAQLTDYQQCARVVGDLDAGLLFKVECEPVVAGRFLMIKNEKTTAASLVICELEVYSSKEALQDVAHGKPCKQSSRASTSSAYGPELAVDGQPNKLSPYSVGSCAKTLAESKPWWLVDLQGRYTIQTITITSADTYYRHISDLVISIGEEIEEASSFVLCTKSSAAWQRAEIRSLYCDQKTDGKIVKIEMQLTRELTLCEVQVYAEQAEIFTYGGNASRAKCVLPFVYKNVTYTECTTVDRKKSWCAVTSDYDIDTLWGYCMDIRLRDGRHATEGRVEMLIKDNWENICDDGWNNQISEVICKQLGYKGGDAAFYSMFPPGRSRMLVTDVHCHGNESALRDCEYQLNTDRMCQPSEAAAVVCDAHEGIKYYGHPAYARASQEDNINATILIQDPIQVPGFIESWHFYASKDNTDVSFQVWRPVNNVNELDYMLVGESTMVADRTGYYKIVSPLHSIRVQPGDLIGFSFTKENPIPYDISFYCNEQTKVIYQRHAEAKVGNIQRFYDKDERQLSCRVYSLYVKVKIENILHVHEYSYGSKHYNIIAQKFTIESAAHVCQSHISIARLLDLTSAQEATVLRSELTALGANGSFWMGNMVDLDPRVVEHAKWASCQPEKGKHCFVLSNDNAKGEFLWYTKRCDEKHFIICQYDIIRNDSVTNSPTQASWDQKPVLKSTRKNVVLPVVLPIILILMIVGVVVAVIFIIRHRRNATDTELLVPAVKFHRTTADGEDQLHVDTPPATDSTERIDTSSQRNFTNPSYDENSNGDQDGKDYKRLF